MGEAVEMAESRADELTRIVVLLLVVLAFVVIILMDLVKAGRRKAHWIPCDFLVLNALIIQLLNMLSEQSALLKKVNTDQNHGNTDQNHGNIDDIDIELCMIHSSRVMLCVVVAYLLPGMASHGSENFWGKLLALIITIFINMTSEVYNLHTLGRRQLYPSMILFVCSASIISISFILLILVLGCANIASRGVEVVFVQKIPLLLSESASTSTIPSSGSEAHEDNKDEKWKTSERQVLRAWIVARAYSPEYIIARSPLTCSVAAIVTLQIAISVVAWILKKPKLKFPDAFARLRLFVTVMQCFFILMGWAIIAWRWFTAVAKYQRWFTDTWRSTFRVEDFWTRHIRELMDTGKQKLVPKKRLQRNVKKLTSKQKVKIQVPSFFLQLLLQLQWQLVLFSKVCWFFSIMIFHNKYTSNLLSAVLKKQEKMEFEDYEEYVNVLEGLDILGETPRSLWMANQNAIAKARDLIVRGHRDAEYKCEELIYFLSKHLHGKEYCNGITKFLESHKEERNNFEELVNFLKEKEKGTFKYLYRKVPNPVLEVQKHFVEAGKWSWKMTTVSLISILIQLSLIFDEDHKYEAAAPYQRFKDGKAWFPSTLLLLKVYSQAWEIINFIEETDLESDGIMSKAADTHFSNLKRQIKKGTISTHKCPHGPPEQCVPAAIDELADEYRTQTEHSETRLPLFQAFAECARRKKEETSESGKKGPAVGSTAGKTADETGESEFEKKGPAVDSMARKTGQKNRSEKTECTLDSLDWKRAAAGNAVYNLCKSIEHSPNEKDFVKHLVEEIICTLTSIIYICTEKVGRVAVEKSKKWARDLDENKIGEALYPVGKARVVSRLLREAESKTVEAEGRKRISVEGMDHSPDTPPYSHSLVEAEGGKRISVEGMDHSPDTPPYSHSLVISS